LSAQPALRTKRHEIGDALYDLYTDPDGQSPDRVLMYPVEKVTGQYVWVRDHACLCGRTHPWDDERRLMRFSRAALEGEGHAWNRPNRLLLYTQPMLDWPPLVVSVSGPRELAGRTDATP
jgi:hypothetical protein